MRSGGPQTLTLADAEAIRALADPRIAGVAPAVQSGNQQIKAGSENASATVIGTWGSSPRPVGSLLGCNAEGSIVGSLSGGCVEDVPSDT